MDRHHGKIGARVQTTKRHCKKTMLREKANMIRAFRPRHDKNGVIIKAPRVPPVTIDGVRNRCISALIAQESVETMTVAHAMRLIALWMTLSDGAEKWRPSYETSAPVNYAKKSAL